MTPCCFAVIPDGADLPTAQFTDLEDAITWALARYGGDRFRIRRAEGEPRLEQARIAS
jgi:hypothetical protein